MVTNQISKPFTIKRGLSANKRALPLIIEAGKPMPLNDCRQDIEAIVESELPEVGGILLRNFDVPDLKTFRGFTQWFTDKLASYDYGSTPRSELDPGIYTSTEYPPEESIPLHSEMSYTDRWPRYLWFHSVIVAKTLGMTPIADTREIYRNIDPVVRDRFTAHGLTYIRNYQPGVDVPWTEVFNTQDRDEVETICRDRGIDYEWIGNKGLRTKQTCQSIATHPETGETLWFNQAHLFHVTNLQPQFVEALRSIYAEDELPRNVLFGDGTPIPDSDLDHIRQVLKNVHVEFPWQEKDILMLDNMLTCHGRTSYTGLRKLVVAMS